MMVLKVMYMSLATRLKAARKAKGLTQKELAALVGVTGSAIGNYEKSVSSPNEDTLIRLMDALGVDANYLYADDMAPRPAVVPDLSENEQRLFALFHSLNALGQGTLVRLAESLADDPAMKKDTQSKAI
jgi:transcriptional regulator with XRE-family HTH domain